MAGFGLALQSFSRKIFPSAPPVRLLEARRVRLIAAIFSGLSGGIVMLAAYYATLGFLPSASAYPDTEYPVAAWTHRLDLAQFVGTLLHPPVPTSLTWWIGFVALIGTLTALGVIYAILLAWTLQTSNLLHGVGYGAALFVGLALTLTVANGLHPAILRNALPDTGLFLLGWSALATVQLLLIHLLYGAVLGTLYQRLTR